MVSESTLKMLEALPLETKAELANDIRELSQASAQNNV